MITFQEIEAIRARERDRKYEAKQQTQVRNSQMTIVEIAKYAGWTKGWAYHRILRPDAPQPIVHSQSYHSRETGKSGRTPNLYDRAEAIAWVDGIMEAKTKEPKDTSHLTSNGRLKYDPELHYNQSKPWLVSDVKYVIENYYTDGARSVGLALGRTEDTVHAMVRRLRDKGEIPAYPHWRRRR